MKHSNVSRYRAFLHGLDETLAKELSRVLRDSHCEVSADAERADIAFCPWQQPVFDEVAAVFGRRPVVVVSRLPEVTSWLDALEAGAADYCAAPFESIQMRWLLETHLGVRAVQAAA
jgi:DNA-binding response OmpR family regulator